MEYTTKRTQKLAIFTPLRNSERFWFQTAAFFEFQNGSLKGTVKLHKLLFGGSNNVSGGYRMLRANTGMSPDLEENYCTPDWKTFTDDSTNGSVNFLTTLDSAENNDALFRDVENLDLTISPGTTIYVKGVGDPRWIK